MQSEFKSPLQTFLRATLWLIPAMLLVRVFESLEYVFRYGLPEHSLIWIASSGANDLLFVGMLMATLGILFLALLWLIGIRTAAIATTFLSTLIIFTSIMLSMYFVQARVPLGAELFGYRWQDVTVTARTSTGVGLSEYLKLFILLITVFTTWWSLKRFHPSSNTTRIYVIGILISSLLYWIAPLSASVWASEVNQPLNANKLNTFLTSSVKYAASKQTSYEIPKNATFAQEYPLMKPANQVDVLGPYFNLANTYPNIVVVTVEGLGKSLMPDGRYGGFTPFIESLTEKSLYFPNFIATSGRTFGFMPSFFGSLPPGESGFQTEGARMPAHDTLISLIKKNGYRSNLFVGFNANFDNRDVFLERQGINHILHQGNFGSGYQAMPPNEGGFSWGYADADLFKRAQDYLADTEPSPRLDIYHTLNLHEPFDVPDTAIWQKKLEDVLAHRNFEHTTKAEIERNPNIFRAVLYSDDALQKMFAEYAKRADFNRTIFIITGDHRVIPLPDESPIDRFSVPLIIWSPLLKHPEKIQAVSSHADVTPSLISFLRNNYHLNFPEQAHWLGTGLDMSATFRNTHTIALMRIKNTLADFLSADYFLSGDELYRVLPDLKLEKLNNDSVKTQMETDFSAFKAVNRYVMQNNKIKPDITIPDPQLAEEQAAISRLNLQVATPVQAYEAAKILLDEKHYDDVRLIARHVLRDSPNYLDIRMLIGRSYAWQSKYEEANLNYEEVIRRDPNYYDAYSALADIAMWSGKPTDSLAIIEKGLIQNPNDTDLLLHKVRALASLNQLSAAQATLGQILKATPDIVEAQTLSKQLLNKH
jgi:lipoteichoic acid synthase